MGISVEVRTTGGRRLGEGGLGGLGSVGSGAFVSLWWEWRFDELEVLWAAKSMDWRGVNIVSSGWPLRNRKAYSVGELSRLWYINS